MEKYFTIEQKKKAKREYKRFKSKNPDKFNVKRQQLTNYLAESILNRPPKWGSLKITFFKN